MRSPVDGMAFISCNLTATQSKTYLGRASEAPVEAYIMKDLSAGAAAYLTVVVRSRSGAGSRQRVRRRGSPRCYTQAAVRPRMNTERVRKLADGSVVVRLHPCSSAALRF